MAKTLYTIGYQLRTLKDFLAILEEHRIDVVIDVRETPWSHKPGFRKGPLSAALTEAGLTYVHAPFVGAPKALRKSGSHARILQRYAEWLDGSPERLEEFEALTSDLLRAGKRVCLMCFERHPDDCHRGILAERWARKRGRTVEHLAPEGAPRLVTSTPRRTQRKRAHGTASQPQRTQRRKAH